MNAIVRLPSKRYHLPVLFTCYMRLFLTLSWHFRSFFTRLSSSSARMVSSRKPMSLVSSARSMWLSSFSVRVHFVPDLVLSPANIVLFLSPFIIVQNNVQDIRRSCTSMAHPTSTISSSASCVYVPCTHPPVSHPDFV